MNNFITLEQVVAEMFEHSRRAAEKMPFEMCAKISESMRPGKIGPDVRVAYSLTLVSACWDRVQRQPGVPEGAD